jgi:hypothetical protein
MANSKKLSFSTTYHQKLNNFRQNFMDWLVGLIDAKGIDPTNPKTNPRNFGRNCSAFGGG